MPVSIETIVTGKLRENCYILRNDSLDGIIIDPGSNSVDIIDHLVKAKVHLRAIINTHGHYDHIGAVAEIQDFFGVPFYLHSNDEQLLKRANLYGYLFDDQSKIKIPVINVFLDTFDTLRFGTIRVKVIPSPGHTSGSVSFLIENYLFTGDALFHNCAGRTDLPGGDESALRQSLKMLLNYPPETVFYPGHGASATLRDALGSPRVKKLLS